MKERSLAELRRTQRHVTLDVAVSSTAAFLLSTFSLHLVVMAIAIAFTQASGTNV